MIAVYTALWLWAFYGLFTLVMGAYRANLAKRLRWWHYGLLGPFVLAGFVMDVVSNLTLASALFLERPRELLVTQRLQRLIRSPDAGWRYKVARAICIGLLDPLDPTGTHC